MLLFLIIYIQQQTLLFYNILNIVNVNYNLYIWMHKHCKTILSL
jgi:hypothetical protein